MGNRQRKTDGRFQRDKAQTSAEAAADINTNITDALCAGTQKHRKHKSHKGRSAPATCEATSPHELQQNWHSLQSPEQKKFAALLHLQTIGFAIIKKRRCKNKKKEKNHVCMNSKKNSSAAASSLFFFFPTKTP